VKEDIFGLDCFIRMFEFNRRLSTFCRCDIFPRLWEGWRLHKVNSLKIHRDSPKEPVIPYILFENLQFLEGARWMTSLSSKIDFPGWRAKTIDGAGEERLDEMTG